MWRRKAGTCRALSVLVFLPPTTTVPRVGRSRRAMSLSTVLLPGAGTAGQKDHLAGVDLEGAVAQGLAPIRIALAHPVEDDHCFGPSTRAVANA